MVKRNLAVALAAAVGLLGAAAAEAQPQVLTGEHAGAPYEIVVPPAWNGTLVVVAHGYRDKADGPGEVDNRDALDDALAAGLASQGYAVAGSAYRDNGWAVKEGIHDTRALAAYFRGAVGNPETTLLLGFSMGSVVTYDLAERSAGLFDGAIAACAVGAGSPRAWDGAVAALLAYHVAFGMPPSWGTPGDVRDDLDFQTEVLAKAVPELSNPANWGKWEFLRLVTDADGAGMVPPSAGYYPGGLFTNLYFFTEAKAELERRAGGPPAQNQTHAYSLTPAEKAYLASLGVNADALLAQMNAARYAAKPSARNYLRSYAEYSGKLQMPLVSLHTQSDTLVPASHQAAYADTVAAAGRSSLLAQAFTSGIGHCNFTPTQLGWTVAQLESWVKTGAPPFFPAVLGFLPAFAPSPWPYP